MLGAVVLGKLQATCFHTLKVKTAPHALDHM